jgi:hypothetical protein
MGWSPNFRLPIVDARMAQVETSDARQQIGAVAGRGTQRLCCYLLERRRYERRITPVSI